MIISIASGKGGTGKTTIAVNLALSLSESYPVQFLDCDVEEPNSHFFLKPEISFQKNISIPVPEVDEKKCTYCGKCAEVCAYNAIAVIKENVLIFPELCHGCGGCALLCPEKAISEKERSIGMREFGMSNSIQFIHGRLNIGEPMPTPLIRAIKECINPTRIVIIDAPPGTSCPMIESIKESDFCILVTEPTPFGLNDLMLAVEVTKKLKIPSGVIINRSDIGDRRVEEYCAEKEIPLLMSISMDKEIAVAYSKGIPFILEKPKWKIKFRELFEKIKTSINEN
jgi:MinD superfamily P-loop ATPase